MGTGTRYCPSIEDKVVRFAEKDKHQLFLEPEGRQTLEVYVNGISTSLPREVQDQMFRNISGLENAEIMRYGYAVEYDFCPPDQLKNTFETKSVAGLYFAGQINGTTGYEEAGGQGLLAGANAALSLNGSKSMVLDRNQGYLGVLVDDLVTTSVDEPYRMFTSRAEYRLLLRQDNADRRLTKLAFDLGMVGSDRMDRLSSKLEQIDEAMKILRSTNIEKGNLEKFLRRPEVQWDALVERNGELEKFNEQVREQVVFDVKYAGYVTRQQDMIDRQKRLAKKRIPEDFDYDSLTHLRMEAKEKFNRFRPASLEQASRISGITPSDVALIMLHLDGKAQTAS